jgi:hypothetical protein
MKHSIVILLENLASGLILHGHNLIDTEILRPACRSRLDRLNTISVFKHLDIFNRHELLLVGVILVQKKLLGVF